MKINTVRQNRYVHKATVDNDIALRIITERVAEKVGVSLEDPEVTCRAYYSTRSTSTGVMTDVVVEIIDNRAVEAD